MIKSKYLSNLTKNSKEFNSLDYTDVAKELSEELSIDVEEIMSVLLEHQIDPRFKYVLEYLIDINLMSKMGEALK